MGRPEQAPVSHSSSPFPLPSSVIAELANGLSLGKGGSLAQWREARVVLGKRYAQQQSSEKATSGDTGAQKRC